MTDRELLAAYSRQGSAEAFERLVERYGGMVEGVCRRVLGDPGAAADAAQAVFLTLAGKAGRLAGGELGPWLHRAATLAARHVARRRALRTQREREAAEMRRERGVRDPTWDRIRPELDRAIAGLPARYRNAVVLHYLAGRKRPEVAAELGVNLGTANSRIGRGLELLRRKLRAPGLSVSGAVLLAGLGSEAAGEASPGLIAAARSLGGRAAAAGKAGEVSAIAEGIMKSMMWARIRMVAAILAGAAVVGAGGTVAASKLAAAEGAPGAPAVEVRPEDSPVSLRSYWRFFLTFRPAELLDRGSGRLRGTRYRYGVGNGISSKDFNRYSTDDPPQGWAAFDFNDADWGVARLPLDMPRLTHWGDDWMVRKTCLRTRFTVPDPARVKRLALRVRYYGGLIAYVNGVEVGRQHIPAKGELASRGFAEPYPPEAYRPAKGSEEAKTAKKLRLVYGRGYWNIPACRLESKAKTPEAQKILERIESVRLRTIDLEIPRRALRAGLNVLALENRRSPVPRRGRPSMQGVIHSHRGIEEVCLGAEPQEALLSADRRPEGVQVWVEDIHRQLLTEDFLEPGVSQRRVVRIVGARRGRHSAQIVIGSSRKLTGLKAALSQLTGPGGAKLPAGAATVRWARAVNLGKVHEEADRSHWGNFYLALLPLRYREPLWKWRIASESKGQKFWFGRVQVKGFWKHGGSLGLFDRLSESAPDSIPAGTSQPVWLTVEVPAGTAPGEYSGKIALSATGMERVEVPVHLSVLDWTVPPAREFTSYAGIDESPWALARWAGVKPWSQEHWKLVEQAVAWAGKLGARVASVPAVQNSEVGNGKDTMIKRVRKADGSFGYDFTILDRYLAIWKKYGHKDFDVVVYFVNPRSRGRESPPGKILQVSGSAGAEPESIALDPGTDKGKKLWLDLAKAIRARLNEQGIPDQRIHWGNLLDYIKQDFRDFAAMLFKEIPTVGWARASHYGSQGHKAFKWGKIGSAGITWDAAIRGASALGRKSPHAPFAMDRKTMDPATYRVRSRAGWKGTAKFMHLPRADADGMATGHFCPNWMLRSLMELCIVTHYRGFARYCIDGWGLGGYYGPYVTFLVYPGGDGRMDASIRFEVLREGIQEAEARIFLEKQAKLPPKMQKLLDRRTERVWTLPGVPQSWRLAEWYRGWQESSWDLYAACTQAAEKKVPSPEEKKRFFGR